MFKTGKKANIRQNTGYFSHSKLFYGCSLYIQKNNVCSKPDVQNQNLFKTPEYF